MKKLLLILLCLPMIGFGQNNSSVLSYLYKSLNNMETNDLIIDVSPQEHYKLKKFLDNEELLSSVFMRACGGFGEQDYSIHKESNTLIIKNYYDGDFESSAVLDILLFKLHLDGDGNLVPIDKNSNLLFQFNKSTHLVENTYGNNWLFIGNRNICWDDGTELNALFSENDKQIRKIEIPEHTDIEAKDYDKILEEVNAEKAKKAAEEMKKLTEGATTTESGLPMIGFGQIYAGPTGCFSGDCENGKGIFVDDVGNMYIAEFIDGVMNGEVTINYANDDKYTGEWKDGKKNGQGTYTYASGSKYAGEYKDGNRNGQGTMTYADGRVEEGVWDYGGFIGNIIVCSEEDIYEDNMDDEFMDGELTIIKTCFYKNYKTISTAWANARGVYERQYELFQKQNGSYIKVKNSTLFNQSQNQLLSIINHEIQEEYKENASYEETKDCFEDMTLPTYTINQLGIDFDDNEISFHVTFGLSNYCRSVGGAIVSYSLTEIQEYLNK